MRVCKEPQIKENQSKVLMMILICQEIRHSEYKIITGYSNKPVLNPTIIYIA